MKKLLALLMPLTCLANTFAPHTHYTVCFTPQENCTHVITQQIYGAKKSIFVQAYSFTSYPIAHALKYAFEHGVRVKVIVDKSNFFPHQYTEVKYLLKHHVPTWLDYQPRIAHNKVMIFDGNTVETGSFNFTNAAQWHNAENVLIIHSKPLAQAYLANWQARKHLSRPITHMITLQPSVHTH